MSWSVTIVNGAGAPQGATGATGATGTFGGTTNVTGGGTNGGNHAAVDTVVTDTATCTGGLSLIGGGAQLTFTGASRGSLQKSYPSTAGANGVWTATGIVTAAGGGNDHITVTAYAICG
jgi:hypothetical protein